MQQVKDLGLEDVVRFVGFVDDPLTFNVALDLQVLPSVSLECLPYSIVEGMHCGLPSIVSDVGGAKEIVRASGGGCVVAARDVHELAAALAAYTHDPERCLREGAAARKYARKELTAQKMAWKTLAVYERVKSKERRGQPASARYESTV